MKERWNADQINECERKKEGLREIESMNERDRINE